MALIEDLNAIPEPTLVPDGEYTLQVTSAVFKTSDKGVRYISCGCDIQIPEDTETVWHSLFLDHPDDEQSKANFKLRQLRDFVHGVGVEFPLPFDTGDDAQISELANSFIGNQFNALLKTGEWNEQKRNEIKRIL